MLPLQLADGRATDVVSVLARKQANERVVALIAGTLQFKLVRELVSFRKWSWQRRREMNEQ